jgi:hypothetical protein
MLRHQFRRDLILGLYLLFQILDTMLLGLLIGVGFGLEGRPSVLEELLLPSTSGIPYQGWNMWTNVSGATSTPGAPVKAVPQGQGFALFISDSAGGIPLVSCIRADFEKLVPG